MTEPNQPTEAIRVEVESGITSGVTITRSSFPGGDPWEGRHPSVAHFKRVFAWEHLPPHLQTISIPFGVLALQLLRELNDGPELSTALRKLREAKDCAVLQRVLDRDAR